MIIGLLLCCVLSVTAQKIESFQSTQARAIEPALNAYVRPLTCELNLISTTRTRNTWHLTPEQIKSMNGNIDNIRNWGIYQACQKYDCDIMVAVTYNLEAPDLSKGCDITIVGYPAVYVNWKTADKIDMDWIKNEAFYIINQKETESVAKSSTQPK